MGQEASCAHGSSVAVQASPEGWAGVHSVPNLNSSRPVGTQLAAQPHQGRPQVLPAAASRSFAAQSGYHSHHDGRDGLVSSAYRESGAGMSHFSPGLNAHLRRGSLSAPSLDADAGSGYYSTSSLRAPMPVAAPVVEPLFYSTLSNGSRSHVSHSASQPRSTSRAQALPLDRVLDLKVDENAGRRAVQFAEARRRAELVEWFYQAVTASAPGARHAARAVRSEPRGSISRSSRDESVEATRRRMATLRRVSMQL